jgi:hypothetical protein
MTANARPRDAAGIARRVGLTLVLVGALCAAVAAAFAVADMAFRSRAASAQGRVIDEFGYRNLDGAGTGMNFLYNIGFETPEGREVEFATEVVGRQLPEGEPVPVLYAPQDPTNARLASHDGMHFPRLLAPPAAAFLLCGVLLTRRRTTARA